MDLIGCGTVLGQLGKMYLWLFSWCWFCYEIGTHSKPLCCKSRLEVVFLCLFSLSKQPLVCDFPRLCSVWREVFIPQPSPSRTSFRDSLSRATCRLNNYAAGSVFSFVCLVGFSDSVEQRCWCHTEVSALSQINTVMLCLKSVSESSV